MNFEQEFYASFGDKYSNLRLKEVVVKRREGTCTITFLYPSTDKELSDADKKEIINWLLSNLNLEKIELKVKFMRVFLEERLIMKAIQNYFEKRYKLVTTYLNEHNFSIKITPIDICVSVELSTRMIDFFTEHKIASELAKILKNNFLMEVVVNLVEDKTFDDEVDIENVQMKAKYRVAQRYQVEIIKDIIGTNIIPKPEYMSFVTQPKNNVIVAGYIKKIERKEFIAKSGRNMGKERTYFNFTVSDGRGKLDCIHFCSKVNVQVMDALEECMFVLLQGDVKLNKMGKLNMEVKKIALATEVVKMEVPTTLDEEIKPSGPVVEIEKLTSLEQDSMFELGNKYNSKIMNRTIVVFDVETTGLDTEKDEIIELGAVKIENGNIMEKFSTFVKPTKRIPFEVEQLTGISQDMVENAPPIQLVIQEFYEFTRGCTLSGHNLIKFDIKFIKREGLAMGLEFDNPVIDTMNEVLASKLKLTRINLGAVTKALGISLEGAHRAWNDAFATAQVLLKLNEV